MHSQQWQNLLVNIGGNIVQQIYIMTKLFNVHDRLTSLFLCDTIDKWISDGVIRGFSRCFLPFRDSNEKVKNKNNQTLEIYKMDCNTIESATALVGFFDGPSYDSGIGFEIGYGFILGKPIYLLTSDYFKVSYSSEKPVSISWLVDSIANVIHIRNCSNQCTDYQTNLLSQRDELCSKLKPQLTALNTIQSCDNHYEISPTTIQTAFFLDPAFCKSESSRLVLKKIISALNSSNLSYYIPSPTECSSSGLIKNHISAAENIIIYCDHKFDMDVESSIIQGMAAALKKKIWLYSTDNTALIQSTSFILKKNPMIWHSAHFHINSSLDFESMISLQGIQHE